MSSATSACTTEAGMRQGEMPYFDPDDYLLGILKRAVANNQDISVKLDSVGEIHVLSGKGVYFASVSFMEEFCTAPLKLFSVKLLQPDDVAALCQENRVGRNIDELMWQAAFYASRGKLMKGCFRDDVVQLRHWPNLTRLPSTSNTMRIAALLTRFPTSVTLASHLLKTPLNELYEFYSAARCAGLAIAINRKPEKMEIKLKPHRNRSLLGVLLAKIARL